MAGMGITQILMTTIIATHTMAISLSTIMIIPIVTIITTIETDPRLLVVEGCEQRGGKISGSLPLFFKPVHFKTRFTPGVLTIVKNLQHLCLSVS